LLRLLPGLVLRLRRIINKEGIKRQRVGKDIVTNLATTNIHRIEGNGVEPALREAHVAEGRVHLRGYRGDCSVDEVAYIKALVSILFLVLVRGEEEKEEEKEEGRGVCMKKEEEGEESCRGECLGDVAGGSWFGSGKGNKYHS
jgi:hypothetical protein